ncbi:hypothetical protein INS49_013315 [Diaporthe citri]|uniref:uncharacterized protein n=1 Tax=Diaporthe citri TaxID=83186 RepID=UPI001C8158A9|nr:uncharacterized protein INS49_013315 [Diaporthe citri]KAG6357438.1 hypothetical protein INS49_013315 [Diaporthe citri]
MSQRHLMKKRAFGHFLAIHFVPVAITSVLFWVYLDGFQWRANDIQLKTLLFAAKLHEYLIVVSLGDILFHRIRYNLLTSRGVSFGLLVSPFRVSDPCSLFQSPFMASAGFTLKKAPELFTILLVVVVSVLALLAAPSSGVLMTPRYDWWQIPNGEGAMARFKKQDLDDAVYIGALFEDLFPLLIDGRFVPDSARDTRLETASFSDRFEHILSGLDQILVDGSLGANANVTVVDGATVDSFALAYQEETLDDCEFKTCQRIASMRNTTVDEVHAAGIDCLDIIYPDKWTKLDYRLYQQLHAYKFEGSIIKLSMTVLLVHMMLVYAHLLLLAAGDGWCSRAWSGLGELIALAILTQPSPLLQNAGGGIKNWQTWKLRTFVREVTPEGRLELVLKETVGSPRVLVELEDGQETALVEPEADRSKLLLHLVKDIEAGPSAHRHQADDIRQLGLLVEDIVKTPQGFSGMREEINALCDNGGTALDVKLATTLNEFLQPQSDISIHDAAQSILTLLPADKPYSDEGFTFASLVVEVTVQIPYQHPTHARLVRLLKYLTRSPKLVSRSTMEGEEELCVNFQALGEQLRDNFQGPEAEETPLEWVNYHAFLAQLEATGVWTTRMPTFAVWEMRDAFETERGGEGEGQLASSTSTMSWRLHSGSSGMSNEKEVAPPKDQTQGFAAKHASYLKFPKDNPDFDELAEDIRRGQAFEAGLARRREGKETFFFYGTLMDPAIAQEVLGLSEPPVLKPALLKHRGHLRMWGPYPAFMANQDPRVDVKGVACEIEGTEKKDRLAMYEGDKYDEAKCFINLVTEDGETDFIVARVFDWIGDEDELSDGSFDLEVYKLAKAKLYHCKV